MRAELTDDQTLLAETAGRVADDLGVPSPADLPSDDDGRAAWATLARTGLLAMHLEPADGGGGARSIDVALVIEQFAARTSLVPLLGQGVLAPELAARALAPRGLLEQMAAGTMRAAVALDPSLRAMSGWVPGAIAWDARGATHVIGIDNRFRVRLSPLTGGVIEQADLTRVLCRAGRDASVGEVIGSPLSDDDLQRLEAFALSMLAAELVGVMQSALAAAVGHVRDRVQFGVPVGTFQAVQHLAADAEVLLEASRSSMWHAAWAADELDPADALIAARQAKAFASRAAMEVVETHAQLLGGIAITWEERAHLRIRRVLLDRVSFGDEGVQEDAIATALLGGRPDGLP